ncbi:hypothetical protein BN2497_12037 [Janthinobacterium sp. CG23_2]|nr:hypothetical protein BN2497_12037 [Janthinobacterium sp. CG23_2]CUU32416.1 hypothetical protein BN3177_12037 [Janthinobacterium sp. CG23_2]
MVVSNEANKNGARSLVELRRASHDDSYPRAGALPAAMPDRREQQRGKPRRITGDRVRRVG